MLQSKKLCVCEITEVLQLATSTVSKHLSVLRDNGFLLEEKNGKWINYFINPAPDDKRVSSIIDSLDFWFSNDSTTINDKKTIETIDRKKICCK
jgi:Predicted transcriptional regulators